MILTVVIFVVAAADAASVIECVCVCVFFTRFFPLFCNISLFFIPFQKLLIFCISSFFMNMYGKSACKCKKISAKNKKFNERNYTERKV